MIQRPVLWFTLAGVLGTGICSMADITPAYLRCEYGVNPLGIDATAPRLSWVARSDQRGQVQSAYRILVASSPEKLGAETGDLWDSGKVESDASAHIVYAGKALESGMCCHWKVRLWDGEGWRSDWSEPASWTMGLLRPDDWLATWIGYDGPPEALRPGPASDRKVAKHPQALVLPPPRYLRTELQIDKPVRRGTVYATAMGLYELRVNGGRVGEDYFTPGWTDYDRRVCYQTYDVTHLLRQGDNAVGAILADGWYAGYVGHEHKRHHYGVHPRLLVQLHVEHADGSERAFATGPSWRATVGPLLEADLLHGETYDARKEMPGWDEPGFDASAWHRVNITRAFQTQRCAYPGSPVRKFAEVRPVRMTEPTPKRFVFDLGRNIAGFARLKVTARGGTKVILRFSERLNPDGTLYTKNLRSVRATETYYCRGGGRVEVYEPRFTYHGFQYVEVTGLSERPGPDTVTGISVTAAAPAVGRFECSDETANILYDNICRTQRANYIEVPTDCPQRDERLGWTGDAQIFMRTAAWNTDIAAFVSKWLIDVADAQGAGGDYSDVAPRKVAMGRGVAAWADAGIICPWILYQVYGDRQVLEQHYPGMARFVEFCKRSAGDDLLRPDYGYGDWLSVSASTPKDVLATAYFAHSADLLSRIAQALGKEADATRYGKLFTDIKEAFNRAYVEPNGRIKGDTQTVYVLALAFDLLPEAKRSPAAEHLVGNIRARGDHLSTGTVGTRDLLPVLTAVGRLDMAYRLFHNDTFPSWGFCIRHGATSIWERWDGWTPERGFQDPRMNSFSHCTLGAVGDWVFRTVGGIDAAAPGFRQVLIRPRPGGRIRWAKTRFCSIRGPIATDWRLTKDGLRLDTVIPANTTAVVHVPAVDPGKVLESGKPAEEAPAVRFVRMEGGAAVYHVGSGTYRFLSKGWKPER